jgi:hypothetical protein
MTAANYGLIFKINFTWVFLRTSLSVDIHHSPFWHIKDMLFKSLSIGYYFMWVPDIMILTHSFKKWNLLLKKLNQKFYMKYSSISFIQSSGQIWEWTLRLLIFLVLRPGTWKQNFCCINRQPQCCSPPLTVSGQFWTLSPQTCTEQFFLLFVSSLH